MGVVGVLPWTFLRTVLQNPWINARSSKRDSEKDDRGLRSDRARHGTPRNAALWGRGIPKAKSRRDDTRAVQNSDVFTACSRMTSWNFLGIDFWGGTLWGSVSHVRMQNTDFRESDIADARNPSELL